MERENQAAEGKGRKIHYADLLWLYVVGSLAGMVFEGTYCLIAKGAWETHVVSMFFPLCILYGLGFVGFYVGGKLLEGKNLFFRFAAFALVGAGIELITAWILEVGVRMYAWNYARSFANYRGVICLRMTLVWGALGVAFGYTVPLFDRLFEKLQNDRHPRIICLVTILLIMDLAFAIQVIHRWSGRHYGDAGDTRFGRWIDAHYDDAYMKDRFIEWRFMDHPKK